MMLSKQYDVSQWRESRRLALNTFTLRLMNGEDTVLASQMAEHMECMNIHSEIMASLTHVDGEPVTAETSPFLKYDPRTRKHIFLAWMELHTGADALVEEFQTATGVADWYDFTPYQDRVTATVPTHEGTTGILSVNGVKIQEVSLATQRKIAKLGRANVGAPTFFQELGASLVEYEDLDGTRHTVDHNAKDRFVRQPWRGWTYQTMHFLRAAYANINDPDVSDFLDHNAGPKSSAQDSAPE